MSVINAVKVIGGALVILGIAGIARAQWVAAYVDSLPYNAVQHSRNIEYVAGGIGEEAQQRLNQFAKERSYNLKLVFTLTSGNYVADVDVSLRDESGTLVQDVSDGPLFLAKVPAGVYTIVATYDGDVETRNVRVAEDRLRVAYFRWPVNPQTDFVLPADRSR